MFLQNGAWYRGATLVLLLALSCITEGDCKCRVNPKQLCCLNWENKDWVTAFRLTAGVQQSAYDTYISKRNDDLPINRAFLQPGCLLTNGSCNTHYRSGLLDIWPYAEIDKVRVSIYQGGVQRAYVIFDGRTPDNLSWFSKDRVLESSWTNLKSQTFNYFSIDGHVTSLVRRRFYIFHNYGGCPEDYGWLSVADQNNDNCSWGSLNADAPFPAIFFANTRTFGHLGTPEVERADVLTISLKFIAKTRPSTCT